MTSPSTSDAGFLGIDHPLVLFRDLERGAAQYADLGFAPRPVGYHPWGTCMRLIQFEGCSIELMGLFDESLIDERPAGDFRFGRYIHEQLRQREGISLLALNSDDAEGDAAVVIARGVECQGSIAFGRDVVLDDGRKDRTKTTLKVLQDDRLPRLSNFIVHQHRPDLVFRSEWQVHPNGADGICQVSIMAERNDWPLVRSRLTGLYGEDAILETPERLEAKTGNGLFVVMDRADIVRSYGPLPAELAAERHPSCVAIHVTMPGFEALRPFLARSGAAHEEKAGEIRLRDASPYGNVFLAFVDTSAAG